MFAVSCCRSRASRVFNCLNLDEDEDNDDDEDNEDAARAVWNIAYSLKYLRFFDTLRASLNARGESLNPRPPPA